MKTSPVILFFLFCVLLSEFHEGVEVSYIIILVIKLGGEDEADRAGREIIKLSPNHSRDVQAVV